MSASSMKLSQEEAEELLDSIAERPQTLTERDSRNYAMCLMYAMGLNLQDIGDHFGITREGVRVVIKKSPYCGTSAILQARKRLYEQRNKETRQRVLDWSSSHIGIPISEAVTELGMPEEDIRAYLGKKKLAHGEVWFTNGKSEKRSAVSDDELRNALQEFIETTEPPHTAPKWNAFAESKGDLPKNQMVVIRLGRWVDLIESLGGKPIARRKGMRFQVRKYDDIDLWRVVIEQFSKNPSMSVQEFHKIADSTDDYPSLATVKQRLGSWEDVRCTAIQVMTKTYPDEEFIKEASKPFVFKEAPRKVNTEEAISLLTEAAGMSGELRVATYSNWAKENNKPSLSILTRDTGLSYHELAARAGIDIGRKPERFTDDEILSAVREFAHAHKVYNTSEYRKFSSQIGKPVPSITTIDRRYGSLSIAVAVAQGDKL